MRTRTSLAFNIGDALMRLGLCLMDGELQRRHGAHEAECVQAGHDWDDDDEMRWCQRCWLHEAPENA